MKGTMHSQSQLQYRTTNGGFTLIEVLIAIFIGAIILTVLYASFFQIVKAKERVEEELELYHEARVIMSKMTKDIVTAFPRGLVNSDETNITTPFFLGTRDGNYSSLSFTALSRTPGHNSKESDQTEISYYLEPIPNSDLFALMRRDNPTIDNEEGGTQYPLSERIAGFNLAYITGTGSEDETGEYAYEWNSNETASMPAGVYIELILRNPRGENITFNTMVAIPIVH